MKYLIIFMLVTFILKDCFCGKKEGLCNYQPSHSQEILDSAPSLWRVYGYIESEAPYRNPYYIHFGESLDCSIIFIADEQDKGLNRIEILIYCGDLLISKGSCRFIQLQPNKTGTLSYFPFTADHNCKEWSAIDRYHTDFVNYFIMFGCENELSDHSHYTCLWIFIRSDSLANRRERIEKEVEEEIKKKIHRIIDTDYSDIKRDIIFVSNWTHWSEPRNCTCQAERPFQRLYSPYTACQIERLEACVPREVKKPINVLEIHGIQIIFILIIIMLLASIANDYLTKEI